MLFHSVGALRVHGLVGGARVLLALARGVGLRIAYYAPLVGAWFGLYEAFRGALDSVGQ